MRERGAAASEERQQQQGATTAANAATAPRLTPSRSLEDRLYCITRRVADQRALFLYCSKTFAIYLSSGCVCESVWRCQKGCDCTSQSPRVRVRGLLVIVVAVSAILIL